MEQLTEQDFDKLDNYLFIIKTLAERSADEYGDAIAQVCMDAMKVTAKRLKEE